MSRFLVALTRNADVSTGTSELGIQMQKEGREFEKPRDGKLRHPEVAVVQQLTAPAQTHPRPSLPEGANEGDREGAGEGPHLPPRAIASCCM